MHGISLPRYVPVKRSITQMELLIIWVHDKEGSGFWTGYVGHLFTSYCTASLKKLGGNGVVLLAIGTYPDIDIACQ